MKSQPRKQRGLLHSLRGWLVRHLQTALASLGRMSRAPLATLMTSMVLGIAIALPSGMWVMLDNIRQISGSWDGAASISMYLELEAEETAVHDLIERLEKMPEIASLEYLTRNDALLEFQQFSGFGQALEILEENPLPAVLVITPALQYSEPAQAELLLARLQKEPLAASTQLDLEWVRRFHAITEIAIRAVIVLASLLGLAVLLIIGNTIRLEIQNRHEEIEITDLIGATRAFIQRPFLYSGFWYGLIGGMIAWLLVSVSLFLVSGPIEQLTGMYQSGFQLTVLDFPISLAILLGSALLGLAGARIAVGRHLSAIEPD